jgi:hypothetical protein
MTKETLQKLESLREQLLKDVYKSLDIKKSNGKLLVGCKKA